MQFLVEFHLKSGSKNQVVDAFEKRGPNRNPGVVFRGAWIGTRSDIAFVLCESESEALVEKVCESFQEHGSGKIHAVVDVENF